MPVFALMSKSNETPSAPKGGNASASADVPASMAPDLEESVRYFWEKNRTSLIGIAVVVLLAILGRHGWDMIKEGQAASAREAYAAADTDAARQTFAGENKGSTLAGAALLEVADNAFKDARYSEAIQGYDAAAAELEGTIFDGRIRLGRAMAQLLSGDVAGGESALRALANDTTAPSAVRSEAAFHLASRAGDAGDIETVNQLATQITAIDPTSNWSQRVTMLQASLETPAEEGETATGITVPGL